MIWQGLLSIANEHSACDTKTMIAKREGTTNNTHGVDGGDESQIAGAVERTQLPFQIGEFVLHGPVARMCGVGSFWTIPLVLN